MTNRMKKERKQEEGKNREKPGKGKKKGEERRRKKDSPSGAGGRVLFDYIRLLKVPKRGLRHRGSLRQTP